MVQTVPGALYIVTLEVTSISLLAQVIFCLTLQKAAVDCTVLGWGSCTVVGAKVDEMTIPTVDVILGRSINGTFFGGQFLSL